MDTLPTDLLTLVSIRLDQYETVLLNLATTDLDAKWVRYNYRREILDFEITKLCRKADSKSVCLLKEFILKYYSKLKEEQSFQIMMLAVRIKDIMLLSMVQLYENSARSHQLLDVVYSEAILYGCENMVRGYYKKPPQYMNTIARRTANALKVGNMLLFKETIELANVSDYEFVKDIMLNPHQPVDKDYLAYRNRDRQLLIRWSIVINRLDLFMKVANKNLDLDGPPNLRDIIECALFNNTHSIIDYLIDIVADKIGFLQLAHNMGYYWRHFWDKIVRKYPFIIHSLDLFQPFDKYITIGNSIDRIELDNLKMLFELSPPSKRELYRFANIAKEHHRYDIYCYAWELLATD